MQYFALTVFLPCFLLALHLSYHRALGPLRLSGLNPVLLIALFVALAAADFASIAATGYGKLGRHIVRTDPGTLAVYATEHAGMVLAFLLGVAFAFYQPMRARRPSLYGRVDMRLVSVVLYFTFFAAWFAWISAYSGDYFTLQGGVLAKIESAGDPVSYTTSLLLLPALSYALCRQPYRVVIPIVLFTLMFMIFSGSRTRLIYTLVPFLFYLVVIRRVKIPRSWFVVGIIVLGTLSVVALNLRALVSYGREVSAERTFAFTNPLNTPDIAVAEASIILPRLDERKITPYPGENLVGMLVAPLPREIVPFKPRAGSVQFTATYDPDRWRSTGSGLVIGAINEIRYDYPYPISLLIAWLFGAGWAFALLKALRAGSIHSFAWIVVLYLSVYNFFRNDLFLVGGPIWVAAVYSMMIEAYRRLKVGAAKGSARPSLPGNQAPAHAPH